MIPATLTTRLFLSLFILAFAAFAGLMITPDSVLAQPNPEGGGGLQPPDVPTEGPSTVEELFAIFEAIVRWLLIIAIVIGVIFIIVGGIRYVTAGGNTEQAAAATKTIAFAAVGIAIILVAFILVRLVGNILGVTPPSQVF
jgi:heme/copper-type cytochrome/quinol oxidase subunit 2